MRIALTTLGSDGDIVSFSRLASALLARGHDVTVCSWAFYRQRFPDGVRFVAVPGPEGYEDLHLAFAEALALPTPWDQLRRFARCFVGLDEPPGRAEAAFATLRAVMADRDMAVSNVLDHLGQAAAEAEGVPWLSWASRPPPDPTVDPLLASTDRALGALLSRVAGRSRLGRTFRARSPVLDLVAGSPALAPTTPPDPGVLITGAWLSPPSDDALPRDVDAFLAAGPALLVTFGTVPDLEGRTEALLASAARVGWRVLLQVLPPTPPPVGPPGEVLLLRARLPYAALLPRVAAVVHHGGSGTLHEIVRAGRPSVAMPHMADQFFWGFAAAARGVGPEVIPYRGATPALLDARLRALREPTWAERAAALGRVIAREDGVSTAVTAIEGIWRATR